MKELLMGNEAVAMGALKAGVQVVAGYPGTPSTEVLETIAAKNPGNVHVEWSVNEKAALEVAAGAAYAGARALVTMKQVGLNVASDPLMCVNYIGVKGALVVYVADDPGPISSQTEQDTRHFAQYAKIPVFDCTSPEEAYEMIGEAFELSERMGTPVIFRSTTRICHSCASVEVSPVTAPGAAPGFVKDKRWVIFPRLSYESKKRLEKAEVTLSAEFSVYKRNTIQGNGKTGICCGGDCFAYVSEAIIGHEDEFTVFKVATPYPFPSELADGFLQKTDKVIVFEELDSVLEDALIYRLGVNGTKTHILGKRTGTVPNAGELSAMLVGGIIARETGINTAIVSTSHGDAPMAPARPPVLCAGCPHRGSFYAVKRACAGKKAVFCGDIGCYTLGNAMPLDMVDTCLCMGAGITVAQGLYHADKSAIHFSFTGDSTFFASGITGVINAVYNKAELILIILDNSTTAMTGHQPHPGIGVTVMKEVSEKISIENVLSGIGVKSIQVVNPLEYKNSVDAVKRAIDESGVRAIIFRSPCAALLKNTEPLFIDTEECVGCAKCVKSLGCPALSMHDGKARIDASLCTGCTLCSQLCPVGCIEKKGGMTAK